MVRVNDNLVISEVDAVMYVVLTKADKYVPYGGFVLDGMHHEALQYNISNERRQRNSIQCN